MWKRWTKAIRDWAHEGTPRPQTPPRIGLALGGGFSRSLAHVGVLQVFEQHQIPIHAIAGISSGSIIAAAYASGTPLAEIISKGAVTTFSSYARWTLSRLGLASSERMQLWLRTILRHTNFEEMQTPLAVVATDLITGAPVVFRDRGDIIAPVRASCSYPGLFLPLQLNGRWLVDGAVSTTVPVQAVRDLGATHVVAVYLHSITVDGFRPANIFQVVSQCFSILQDRIAADERARAELLLEPKVASFAWNDFERADELVEAGRQSALEALPIIEGWLRQPLASAAPDPGRSITAAPAISSAAGPPLQS
ncbi:MAG TPA: patatin-like phospholipase family protein [Bryobacterales bacterium]|jgi:NTE family protein|nr:patatin-like phospholipase family protein [Bryobacterales bacterium]